MMIIYRSKDRCTYISTYTDRGTDRDTDGDMDRVTDRGRLEMVVSTFKCT